MHVNHYSVRLMFSVSELGCEFWLGKIDRRGANDHLLKFKVYVGVNPTDPQDIYIYAFLNRLTLRAVLDAFKVEHNFGDQHPLADTGFPGPFTFSYALKGK